MVLIETDVAYAKRVGKGRKIMEDYIKKAEDAVLKGDLLRSYDKELAYGDEKFREGKEETQKEIIKTMVEKGLTDEEIMEYTNCTKELLNEIKEFCCINI